MSALSIEVPFPVFQDRDGQPLENGYVWLGVANLNPQTNPVIAYFDAALTIPAAQPLRTINGYISNAGTPAQVYIDGASFSILVQDSKGSMVYNFPEGNGIGADACGLTYSPPFTGAVPYPVCEKLEQTISVKDFGAVGDGVADDTIPLTNALNSVTNRVLDGGGGTYRITAPIDITSDRFVVQNMTIDISDVVPVVGVNFIINVEGVQGTAVNLTANLNANTNVVTVGSTASFAEDQYVFIQSNELFWSTITTGQYGKIKTIDSSTQITLYDNVLYNFTTANTARISPVTTKENIVFNNVKFLGAQANLQAALYFELCSDVHVNDCTFNDVDYCCVYVSRCVNVVVNSTQCRNSRATTGLSYGVLFLNGTYNGTVTNGYSEDQRHYVATGSATSQGGVNLYITVANNHITAARNAGIDAHPTTDYYTVTGNTIEQASGLTGTLDGIICQGLNCVITNNTIVNASRHAIFHQLFPNIGSGACIIANNLIRGGGGSSATDTAIFVVNQTTGGAILDGVNITGNIIDGDNEFHIIVTSATGDVNDVAITGNVTRQNATNTSCRIRAQGSGTTVNNITVTGNVFKTSGIQNLYLLGGATSSINRASITGNNINGGTNGIRYEYVNFSAQVNNQFSNNTNKVLIANSTNLVLDTRQEGIQYLTASSVYTVAATDVDIVANRASTITLTMPNPTEWLGRVITIKTIQAQAVDSASANVVPVDSATPGTTILPATAGASVTCKCDGTNWVVMQRGS
jgi:hypothetical protein